MDMSVLICIQSVLHSDSVPKRSCFEKVYIEKGQQRTTNASTENMD